MKVIVDDKIPFIKEALDTLADEVIYAPGKDFTPELVRDADALIIRTRTRCDRRLLEGSRVRFIATATIGFDHIDTAYCQEAGITWQNAPGCNSASVAQYMHSSLLLLQRQKGFRLEGKTLGVIGVGNVGTKVAQVGRELGMRVLLNDPPRQEKEGGNLFSPRADLPRPPHPRRSSQDFPPGRCRLLRPPEVPPRHRQHLTRRSHRDTSPAPCSADRTSEQRHHRCLGKRT